MHSSVPIHEEEQTKLMRRHPTPERTTRD